MSLLAATCLVCSFGAGIFADLIVVADVFFGEVELLEEACYDFWMFFGDIGRFSDVFLEVVEGEFLDVGAVGWGDVGLPEFAFFGFIECGVGEVEFPVAFSDRS